MIDLLNMRVYLLYVYRYKYIRDIFVIFSILEERKEILLLLLHLLLSIVRY